MGRVVGRTGTARGLSCTLRSPHTAHQHRGRQHTRRSQRQIRGGSSSARQGTARSPVNRAGRGVGGQRTRCTRTHTHTHTHTYTHTLTHTHTHTHTRTHTHTVCLPPPSSRPFQLPSAQHLARDAGTEGVGHTRAIDGNVSVAAVASAVHAAARGILHARHADTRVCQRQSSNGAISTNSMKQQRS